MTGNAVHSGVITEVVQSSGWQRLAADMLMHRVQLPQPLL
jgi:hypothetical protein